MNEIIRKIEAEQMKENALYLHDIVYISDRKDDF